MHYLCQIQYAGGGALLGNALPVPDSSLLDLLFSDAISDPSDPVTEVKIYNSSGAPFLSVR
jgi:hypothetical protein